MKQPIKYIVQGQWYFAALLLDMLAAVYAAQTQRMWLLYACIILCIILALGLLVLLLRSDRRLAKSDQNVLRLRQREDARLQKKQQVIDESVQQAEIFDAEGMLSRIIPAADARFDSIAAYSEKILQNMARELNVVQGLVFTLNHADQLFHLAAEYAYYSEEPPRSFPLGETLSGQVAKNRQLLNVKELPEGYITVLSGLGKSAPRHLLIAPVVCDDASIAVIELAAFKPFNDNEENVVRRVGEIIAKQLNELRK